MDDSLFEEIAAQLRKPHGEMAKEIGERMNKGNFLMNVRTVQALDVQKFDQILEIGMGNGAFVEDILKSAVGVRYVGCDYSPEMILLAKEKNQQHINSGIASFHKTTAKSLPVDNQSIDKLFTVNTLYFWDDPTKILHEFKRVLKPTGRLLITFRPEHVMHNYPPTQFNFNYFSEEDITRLLGEHGFTVDEVIHEIEPETEIFEKHFHPEFLVAIASPV